MTDKFAYSYNGENYRGSFDGREEAFRRAMEYMGGLLTLPATIYVGRIVAADAHAKNLAPSVVREMASRARSRAGGPAGYLAADYLSTVTPEQLRDLDASLEMSILGWLSKHGLAPTDFAVDSISEYATPPVRQVQPAKTDEVKELGASDYPAEIGAEG